MGPLNQSSLIQNSEAQFREQLLSLSKTGFLNGKPLIKQPTPTNSILGSIKNLLGRKHADDQRLVELTTLQFLTEGKQWIKTPEDIELVKDLAKKLGLVQSNSGKPTELQALIHEICMPVHSRILSDVEQKHEKEQNGTLSDDQAPSTSQEDNNPQEHSEKSNASPVVQEAVSVPIDSSLLVIPESTSTDAPATEAVKISQEAQQIGLSAIMADAKAKLVKTATLKEDDWMPATRAATIATSAFAALGSLYLLLQSPGPKTTDISLYTKLLGGLLLTSTAGLVIRKVNSVQKDAITVDNQFRPDREDSNDSVSGSDDDSNSSSDGSSDGNDGTGVTDEQGAIANLEQQIIERHNKEKLELKRIAKEQEELIIEFEAKQKLELERIETERKEKERIELEAQQKLELERIENERLEQERIEFEAKQKLELERIETERKEKERIELEAQQKLELERIENERLEQERIELEAQQKLELERIENERKEKERIELETKQKLELERIENERKEQERIELETKQKLELQRIETERKEKERIELEAKQKLELERIENERKEQERIELEAKQKLELEHIENERLEQERIELETKQKLELERIENERLEQERIELETKQKLEFECIETGRKEKERIELEIKQIEEQQRIEKEKQEALRLEQERIEQEKQLGVEEFLLTLLLKERKLQSKEDGSSCFGKETFIPILESLKISHGPLIIELKDQKSISIPLDDYHNFIKKDEYNIQKAYTTILMLSQWLKEKKETYFDVNTGTIPENKKAYNELKIIHYCLEALERDKEILFHERLIELNNPEVGDVLHILQTIAGNRYIPVDYKMSLLEFMNEHPSHAKHLGQYFQIASNPNGDLDACVLGLSINLNNSGLGNSTLGSSLIGGNRSQMTNLKAFPKLFKYYFESLPPLISEGSQSEERDYRRIAMHANLKKMHEFLLNTLGVTSNSHIITDSMKIYGMYDEIGQNAGTDAANKYDASVKKEIAFSKFLPEEELPFHEFHSYDQYGIKVKNKWNTYLFNGEIFACESEFAIKLQDETYTTLKKTMNVSFSKIKDLVLENREFIIQFIQTYCQATEKEKRNLENPHAVLLKPDLQHVLASSSFVQKLSKGYEQLISQENSEEKSIQLKVLENQIIKTISDNYDALIAVCQDFAKQIQMNLNEVMDLPSQENLEASQSFEQHKDLEIYNDDTDDEDEIIQVKKESENQVVIQNNNAVVEQRSFWDVANSCFETATNVVGTVVGGVVGGVGGVLNKVLDTVYPDPRWVKLKFKFAVDNIFTEIKLHPSYSDCIKEIKDINNQDALLVLVRKIFESENVSEDYARNNHTNFVINLRTVLESELFKKASIRVNNNELQNALVDLVLEICRIRFEEGHFYQLFDEVMEQLGLVKGVSSKLCDHDFEIIEKTLKTNKDAGMCRAGVNLGCAEGHFNIKFDPHLNGNIPYVLGVLKINGKKVKLLRTGSPTIEEFVGKAQINPEFKAYLKSGRKHLYISLQNDKSKWMGTGDETGRNQAIKDLVHEFPRQFFAVVLAQDSRFYKQLDANGKKIEEQKSVDFVKEFKDQLFGENTGFYFPNSMKTEPGFQKSIDILLNTVHKAMFNEEKNERVLSRQERLDFIEIFYAYLSVFLIYWTEADNCNISCKDAIDRAGKLNSLVMQLLLITAGTSEASDNKRIHQVLTHMGAMWVKGQAILHSRRDRLITAFDAMNDNMQNIKKMGVQVLDRNQRPVKLLDEKETIRFIIPDDIVERKRILEKPQEKVLTIEFPNANVNHVTLIEEKDLVEDENGSWQLLEGKK